MKQLTRGRVFADLAATQTLDVIQGIRPVWLRLPASMRVSGMSRNTILGRVRDGTLKAKHYALEGKTKGVWFIHFESLMALMDSLPDGKDVLTK